jgi:predicted GNAT family acetyltransferase
MDVTIIDEPGSSRFVILADGEPAGEITYRFHDDRRLIVHTGVDAEFEGKGIGGGAAAALLDLIRAQGELDADGFVLTDHDLPPGHGDALAFETSQPGVFAVGDVRHGSMKRVAAAVGEGSSAVRSVHQRLAPH